MTVRDFLGEILDGNSLVTMGVNSFQETKEGNYEQIQLKESQDDVSSSYLQYLRNEICLRLFRVVRFVNPPTQTLARLFQENPCECLTIESNGTDNMAREHPMFPDASTKKLVSEWNPGYPDVSIRKYAFQWNDEVCAKGTTGPVIPIKQNRSDPENLFWVSSPAYWKNKSSVRYRSVAEGNHDTWIKVEPMSDVVTDFFFKYQLNIPVKFIDGISSLSVMDIYPVLLTVTYGVSGEHVEDSIHHSIWYPKERVVNFIQWLGIFVAVFVISGSILLVSFVRNLSTQPAEPLLN